MPLVNYCKKCRAEVPVGEMCPYCCGKLTKTGEQISYGFVRVPVKDWFAWNNVLRVALPVLGAAFVIIVAAEASATGLAGVEALLSQGLVRTLLGMLAMVLLVLLALLLLQGRERVHVVLDKQGITVRTYIEKDNKVALYAHLVTEETADKLAETDERPPLNGLTQVRRVSLSWAQIRRVRIWREGRTLLFFRPTWWQAAAVHCPGRELPEAEAMIRQKLKRMKKVRVLPIVKEEKKRKSQSVTQM